MSENKPFAFQLHNRLLAGVGSSVDLGTFLKHKGFSKPAIIVDEGVSKHSDFFQEVLNKMKSDGTVISKIKEVRGNEEPDYDYLDEVAEEIRSVDFDCLIGIGGGSALDLMKAVSILKTNPGKGIEYRGFDHVKTPGIPTIAIPSTAGTGSEVTINAVFTDKKDMKKLGINGNYLNATYAVLDAKWTISCPESAAISSGMDALVHGIESFMCKQASAVTRMFSREGVYLSFHNLPCLTEDPKNLEKRQNLLLASYIAATGLFNSGSGIASAFSYPLGVHFKVPHGIGGGIFIASVVEYNIAKEYYEFADLYDYVFRGTDKVSHGQTNKEKSENFLGELKDICARLKVPSTLKSWGVTRSTADKAVELLEPMQGAYDQNPVPFQADRDIRPLLDKHLGG